jgi:hypothetical protein
MASPEVFSNEKPRRVPSSSPATSETEAVEARFLKPALTPKIEMVGPTGQL